MRIGIVVFAAVVVGCMSSQVEPGASTSANPSAVPNPSAEANPSTSPNPSAEANPSAEPSPSNTLTIGSYNVLYMLAEKRPDVPPAEWADADTLRVVQSLDVDILLLQETNEAWEGAIRSVVSTRFPYCSFHAPKRFLPEGLGVCSKYPLEGDTTLPSPVGWFPAQFVSIKAPSGPVGILQVHLRPAVAGPDNWMEVHRATRPDRKKEVESYLGRRPKGAVTLIVGDFNELPEGDLFHSLAEAGFQNALPMAGEQGWTWHWEGAVPPLSAQIDHLAYASSSLDLVSAKVGSGGRSDHVPLIVTLRPK